MNANPHPLYDELLLRAYVRHLRAQGRSDETVGKYQRYARQLLRLFQAWDAHPLTINSADLDVWLEMIPSETTRGVAYSAAVDLCDFLSDWHGRPVHDLHRQRGRWRRAYTTAYTPEEMSLLCQVGSVGERIRGYLTLRDAVPAGQLRGLTRANFNEDASLVRIGARYLITDSSVRTLALSSDDWSVQGGVEEMSAWLRRACQLTGVPFRHWRRTALPVPGSPALPERSVS